jgi:c-di-GMP-binding flagellar brake protein YcgR
MKERRKYPRIKGVIPLKLSDSKFDIVTETKNISGNGVYCSIDKPIQPMTKLSMVIFVPFEKNRNKIVKKISCHGVVVRNEYVKDNGKHAYHVGIYFNEIKERDRKIILSYITRISKTSKQSDMPFLS